MPNTKVKVPVLTKLFECNLFYLYKLGESVLDYLQVSRSDVGQKMGILNPEYLINKKKLYDTELSKLVQKFINLFDDSYKFDIIICPPSNSNFQEPYYNAILNKFKTSEDMSQCFTKPKDISSGKTRKYDVFYNNITYSSNPKILVKNYSNLLIVDDVFAEGKTVAAIFQKLNEDGFVIDNYFVACPLYAINGDNY